MWWNLVRLGEDLAELFVLEDEGFVQQEEFLESGIPEAKIEAFVANAEKFIEDVGEYYKFTLETAHSSAFGKRLGLVTVKDDDSTEGIVDSALQLMKEHALDFNHFFRRLGRVRIFPGDGEDDRCLTNEQGVKDIFLTHERGFAVPHVDDSASAIHKWLFETYKPRLVEENLISDQERKSRMDKVNPNFVLRTWILDEVIDEVQHRGDTKLLEHVLYLALNPFEEFWTAKDDDEETYKTEMRFIGDVPRRMQALTCSCSS